jgi:hypothetical protein
VRTIKNHKCISGVRQVELKQRAESDDRDQLWLADYTLSPPVDADAHAFSGSAARNIDLEGVQRRAPGFQTISMSDR